MLEGHAFCIHMIASLTLRTSYANNIFNLAEVKRTAWNVIGLVCFRHYSRQPWIVIRYDALTCILVFAQ